MKKLLERVQEPTPRYFQKIRNIGLILTAVSSVISTAPIALPVIVIKIASYVAIAGGIASAISQTAVSGEQ